MKLEDFADAHIRHWKDAELLFRERRLANADHLYGISAECGLKTVMKDLGDFPELPSDYRKHFPKLWTIFQDFAKDRDGARYAALLAGDDPFSDWSIADRYAHRSNFAGAAVKKHRQGVETVRSLVQQWEQENAQ